MMPIPIVQLLTMAMNWTVFQIFTFVFFLTIAKFLEELGEDPYWLGMCLVNVLEQTVSFEPVRNINTFIFLDIIPFEYMILWPNLSIIEMFLACSNAVSNYPLLLSINTGAFNHSIVIMQNLMETKTSCR